MIEDELRTSFARHEELVPDAQRLGPVIDAGARRFRRQRAVVTSSVAALAVLVAVAVPFLAPHLTGRPDHAGDERGTAPPAHTSVAGPLNFLLLGVDRRPTQPATDPARTDTIMVVHIPASLDRGYLISIPRDLLVDIPGYGRDKINAAYAHGGSALATRVVENVTGLTFDGTAEMRFEGLSRLTDALGGVSMCIDERIVSVHTERVFREGCQHLSGDEAIDLLRQRYSLPGASLDRDRNARQFVAALLDQADRADLLTDPNRLAQVLSATGDAMTLDLPRIGLFDLTFALRGLHGDNLTGDEVPTTEGTYHGMQILDAAPTASELFAALRNDDLERWFARK